MRKTLISLATLPILVILTAGIHDTMYPTEDSRIVWLCGIHGDRTCGPNTPPILIDPGKLFEW